jgi:hypothetical protein
MTEQAESMSSDVDDNSDKERIALLAYSYWEARRGPDGSPEEDWLRAEQDLRPQTVERRLRE